MIRQHTLYLILTLGVFLFIPLGQAQEKGRGHLLYETHCLQCHESNLNIKNKSQVQSLLQLKQQVVRWGKVLNLGWQDKEIMDITLYLNQAYYQFSSDERANPMPISITSPSFERNSEIPARYTCDGVNISPALSWSNIPDNAKSLALIVDDPDAPDPATPKMTWVHWVLYNIPVTASELSEAITQANLPTPTQQGLNDWKKIGYGGPCPPIGRHRYLFKLYALDTILPNLKKPSKAVLEKAMQGHIIDHTELMGTYKRP